MENIKNPIAVLVKLCSCLTLMMFVSVGWICFIGVNSLKPALVMFMVLLRISFPSKVITFCVVAFTCIGHIQILKFCI